MRSKLITPESPLLVPPLLAAKIGLSEAIILQQIHYYCLVSKHIKQDGRRWFWKTLNDWGHSIPFLSISTIRRAIALLTGAMAQSAQTWRKPIAHNPYSTPITCFLSQNLADRIPNLYDNVNQDKWCGCPKRFKKSKNR